MAKLISRNLRAGPPGFGTCCAWFRQITWGTKSVYIWELYIMYLTLKMTRLALQATTNSQQGGLVTVDWDTGHAFLYFSDLELMNPIDANNVHEVAVAEGLRY